MKKPLVFDAQRFSGPRPRDAPLVYAVLPIRKRWRTASIRSVQRTLPRGMEGVVLMTIVQK